MTYANNLFNFMMLRRQTMGLKYIEPFVITQKLIIKKTLWKPQLKNKKLEKV